MLAWTLEPTRLTLAVGRARTDSTSGKTEDIHHTLSHIPTGMSLDTLKTLPTQNTANFPQ